jgi:hypothetical protein
MYSSNSPKCLHHQPINVLKRERAITQNAGPIGGLKSLPKRGARVNEIWLPTSDWPTLLNFGDRTPSALTAGPSNALAMRKKLNIGWLQTSVLFARIRALGFALQKTSVHEIFAACLPELVAGSGRNFWRLVLTKLKRINVRTSFACDHTRFQKRVNTCV